MRRIRSKVIDEQHSESTGFNANLGGKVEQKRATTWRELIGEEEEALEGSGGEESEEGLEGTGRKLK